MAQREGTMKQARAAIEAELLPEESYGAMNYNDGVRACLEALDALPAATTPVSEPTLFDRAAKLVRSTAVLFIAAVRVIGRR